MELILKELGGLELAQMYERDLLSLETLSDQELAGVLATADALQLLRRRNYGVRVFESGLALSLGEPDADFWGACDLLGLRPFPVDEGELLPHLMLADVIGADEENAPKGSREVGEAYEKGLLDQRPTTLNLALADPLAQLLWLIHGADGVENLRGKLVAFDGGESTLFPELEPFVPQGVTEVGRLVERMGAVVCSTEELFPNGKDGPMLPAWVIHTQGPEAMAWRRYRPYVLAAMIFLAKAPKPVNLLRELQRRAKPRRMV